MPSVAKGEPMMACKSMPVAETEVAERDDVTVSADPGAS